MRAYAHDLRLYTHVRYVRYAQDTHADRHHGSPDSGAGGRRSAGCRGRFRRRANHGLGGRLRRRANHGLGGNAGHGLRGGLRRRAHHGLGGNAGGRLGDSAGGGLGDGTRGLGRGGEQAGGRLGVGDGLLLHFLISLSPNPSETWCSDFFQLRLGGHVQYIERGMHTYRGYVKEYCMGAAHDRRYMHHKHIH